MWLRCQMRRRAVGEENSLHNLSSHTFLSYSTEIRPRTGGARAAAAPGAGRVPRAGPVARGRPDRRSRGQRPAAVNGGTVLRAAPLGRSVGSRRSPPDGRSASRLEGSRLQRLARRALGGRAGGGTPRSGTGPVRAAGRTLDSRPLSTLLERAPDPYAPP